MGYQKNKKRAAVKSDISVNEPPPVTPISLKAAVIDFGGRKCYFERLAYKGCPALFVGRNSTRISSDKLKSMHRDDFVIEMYHLFQGMSTHSTTGNGIFKSLVKYVMTLDKHDRHVDFSESNVLWYCEYQQKQYLKGELTKPTWSTRSLNLAEILKMQGNSALARKIPTVKGAHKDIKKTESLGDETYAKIAKKLMIAFKGYSRAIIENKKPDACFLITEDELIECEKSKDTETYKKLKRKSALYKQNNTWMNNASSIAAMIVAMWTGANTKPLMSLKRSDVVFLKNAGNNYTLNSVKARALYAKKQLGIGFSKYTKEFIETWLIASSHLTSNEDDPLFPFFGKDGVINLNSLYNSAPQYSINNIFDLIGYERITTSKFRATRSSILQRAYLDIFVTAQANGNSIETTRKHYSEGNKDQHEMQLAGAFDAQFSMAGGKSKKEAIDQSTYRFKDIFTNDEWLKKKGNNLPNQTPIGTRCTEPFGEKAKKTLRVLRELPASEYSACVDFLACFECEHHVLIAEEEDIWLMLSFKDSIMDAINKPSKNSIPSSDFYKINGTVDSILKKFKEIAPNKYKAAYELNQDSPHPLYDDEFSINDMVKVMKWN